MNELDEVLTALAALDNGRPGKASNYLHKRIRALEAKGMKSEEPTLCSNPGCKTLVQHRGQMCGDCFKNTHGFDGGSR